jgi:membrane protein required for colicin V production
MTALDIIFFLLVGLGLVFGVMRGFVKEVLSLAIWVVAIIALRLFHGPVSELLIGVIGTVSGAYVLAFALIAIIVIGGGKLIVGQLSGRIKRSAVGPLDRILGGGFGALKGLVGVALLYMAFSLVYDTIWGRASPRPVWIAEAQTYAVIHGASNSIVDLVERRRGNAAAEEAAANSARPR